MPGDGHLSQTGLMIFRKPIPITGGVFQIRAIGARATVLVEDGEVLLVDAGLRGSWGTITRGLKALDLSPDQIGRVVVTHAHPDHSGGLGELVAGRVIAVAAHRLEADIIEGREPAPSPLQNGLPAMMAQPILTRLMGNPVPVDDRLEDGDILPFGTEVRAVHLPGHTPGSVALHLPEKRVSIVGDGAAVQVCLEAQPTGCWSHSTAEGGDAVPGEAPRSGLRHHMLQSLPSHAERVSQSPPRACSAACRLSSVVVRWLQEELAGTLLHT